MPSAARSRGRDLGGAGEAAIRSASPSVRRRDRPAARARQRAGELAPRLDGDLLAEHRAHRELEAVPAAGHAQAGPLGDQRRQQRIARQVRADRGDVGAEIEHAADARDDRRQRAHVGKADGHRQALLLGHVRDLDGAGLAVLARPCAGRRRRRPARRRRSRARAGTPASPPSRRAGGSAARTVTPLPATEPSGSATTPRRRSALGGRRNSCWNVSLKRRTLPKPEASAISAIGSRVSWISCLANSTRRVCATGLRRRAQVLLEQAAQLARADAQPLGELRRRRRRRRRARRPRSAPARARPCSRCRARCRGRARSRDGSAGRGESPPPARPPPKRRSGSSRAAPCAPGRPGGSRSRSRSRRRTAVRRSARRGSAGRGNKRVDPTGACRSRYDRHRSLARGFRTWSPDRLGGRCLGQSRRSLSLGLPGQH